MKPVAYRPFGHSVAFILSCTTTVYGCPRKWWSDLYAPVAMISFSWITQSSCVWLWLHMLLHFQWGKAIHQKASSFLSSLSIINGFSVSVPLPRPPQWLFLAFVRDSPSCVVYNNDLSEIPILVTRIRGAVQPPELSVHPRDNIASTFGWIITWTSFSSV